jgi:hypothetical protein
LVGSPTLGYGAKWPRKLLEHFGLGDLRDVEEEP